MSTRTKVQRDSDAAQTTQESGVLAATVGNFAADQIDHGIDISDEMRPERIREEFKFGSTGALSNSDGKANLAHRAFEDAV